MKKFLIILLVLIAVIVPSGVILARNLLMAPLDPPLELDVPAQVAAQKAEVLAKQSEQQNDKTCGNTGKMSIFQVATASPGYLGHVGADSIRLVVVDFDAVTVDILALPADVFVETPEDLVEELDYFAPLNLIYQAALDNATGNDEQVRTRKATQVLAQTVLDVFGFVPDKYININGEAFVDLVDTVGEITIILEEEIDGSAEFYGVFDEGENILDGERALDFVRMLYPNGVGPDYFGRFDRQNMVMLALMDQVLKPENWDEIDDILKDARKMVVTDLSVDQARDLACMVEEVDGDANLMAVTEENDLVFINQEGQMIPDIEAIQEIITEMLGLDE